jgi:glutamyl-tRNA reductase
LRKKVEEIAKGELEKTLRAVKHLSADDLKAINRMTDAMVNKILHNPTMLIKSSGQHQDKSVYLDVTRKLFRLDE